MKIGRNLQEVVQSQGMDLEAIRTSLGWEPGTLEKILSDSLSPAISELLQLAALLGVDITTLLYGKTYGQRRAIKTSRQERVSINRRDFLHYESLAPAFYGRHMEPFIVDIYPEKESERDVSKHPGEEFLYLLSGQLQIVVNGEVFLLEAGDSFYFDSSLPHTLQSLAEHSRVVAIVYNSESMIHLTRGKQMKSLIETAKLLERSTVIVVCPDPCSLTAINKAIQEGLLRKAILVGKEEMIQQTCKSELLFPRQYEYIQVTGEEKEYEAEAARLGAALIAAGRGQMLMKGKINTATFIKAVLHKENGISSGRRLSMVSLFELPGVDRLILLTDPGINPELFIHQEVESGVDIIENAVDVARSLGIERPKVALLEANEVPSEKIPTTMLEKQLSQKEWLNADVYGPLSYDLALYPEAVAKKGLPANPVAGQANILVVPTISGGNFLYKTWVMTLGAEVANVVLGANTPIILTSRSDSEVNKFLTICAGAIYSHFLQKNPITKTRG